MDFIYYIFRDFVYYGALVFLLIFTAIALISAAKPGFISQRPTIFTGRKKAATLSMLSILLLAGLAGINTPGLYGWGNENNFSNESNSGWQDDAEKAVEKVEIQTENQEPINKKILKQSHPIPFEKRQKNDAGLTAGQKKLSQKGQSGLKILYFEVTYRGGEEIRRQFKSEKIIKQPVPQILAVGSMKPLSDSTKNDGRDNFPQEKSNSCSFFSSFFRKLYGIKC